MKRRVESEDAQYEWLRDALSALEAAEDDRSRRLVWVTAAHKVAVSRGAGGRLEIYLVGAPVDAASSSVAEVLEHREWRADDGSEFSATRVVLPLGEHFDQFAALLCVELVEHGAEDDVQTAFTAVEPLIVLTLSREALGNLTLLGLIGELAFLERLLQVAAPAESGRILRCWAGSAPSARDFQLGSVGVEVKTTQGSASIHQVEGVHQVELGRSNEGVRETHLFMLSVGVGWTSAEGEGRSLPELVDSILSLLDDPADCEDFLARIKQYGGDAAIGYDHVRDLRKARYASRFHFKFERLYDMTDDRLNLLSSRALAGLSNVDPGSVTFRVVLPDRVRGELNPVIGWPALSGRVLALSGVSQR